ncbi:MAG: phosphate/phosphite/phosphonate ABC transporter substrate-binding protein [Chloroflexaceae bacterium]|nr:phosphate/phosphite/phosphonate ABC transporter substrate-binding protein [Chloroflexaceae bacterium]
MTKYTFMVCPHDTIHNPERWYELERYFIARLGTEVLFEMAIDFLDFQENVPKADIVYTNPSDRISILKAHGYVPVARPMNTYDEVVLVASTEVANPSINSLQGAEIATVTSLIPTHLSFDLLHRQGIKAGALHHKESWQAVISSVWNHEVEFGFVYKDTYDHLSDHGKSLINMFYVSDERKAFHTLEISPRLADRKSEIEQLLLGMDADAAGQTLLQTLDIEKWLPVTDEEMGIMEQLMSIELT